MDGTEGVLGGPLRKNKYSKKTRRELLRPKEQFERTQKNEYDKGIHRGPKSQEEKSRRRCQARQKPNLIKDTAAIIRLDFHNNLAIWF